MQDDRLDYPELFEVPAVYCKVCGYKIEMARHYTQVTVNHLGNGTHLVMFTPESAVVRVAS